MQVPALPSDHSTDAASGSRWARLFLCAGALLGLLTVAMAALAAHLPDARFAEGAVSSTQPGGRELLRTAVEMQGWHVVALLGCGLLLQRQSGRWSGRLLRAAGVCFLLGIIGFCTGLYGLAFAGSASIAGVAPVGGSVLMLGWLALFIGCALPGARA